MEQMVKRLPTLQETQVRSLVGNILWRRKWQPIPVLLSGKSHEQRAWRATVHGAANSLSHTGSQNNFPQTKGLPI